MRRVILAAHIACVVGCSNVPEPSKGTGEPRRGTSALVATSGAPGYRHAPSKSRFALGAGLSTEQSGTYTRLRGTNGVIATTQSGATAAILDASAIERVIGRGPLTRDPSVHTKEAVNYFVSAGLPADQLGATSTNTLMTNGGDTSGANVGTTPGVFRAYFTVIDRAIDRTPVEGSHAWVAFNADGEAIGEEVYWPDIPQSPIVEAAALRASVDATRLASLKAKLADSTKYRDGVVTIHHTPFTADQFEVFVSIDFHGVGVPSHYLRADGSEARFLSQPSPAPSDSKP